METNFSNDLIDINTLPNFEEVVYEPLHKKYKSIIYINCFIVLFIISLATSIFLVINSELRSFWYLFVIGVVIFGLLVYTIFTISFNKRGYALREKDVLYKSGVLATTTTIIPFNRIQHVSVHEGIFSRAFGLSELQIFTAGGSSSDLKIPGLSKDKAEKMKAFLIQTITNEVLEDEEEEETSVDEKQIDKPLEISSDNDA